MSSPRQTKPKTPAFAVEWWPIGRVIPYPNNARVIPASAVEKVASSIRAFGWRQPIVVDTAGVIVAGHVRFLGAQSMALAEVPVHVAKDLSFAVRLRLVGESFSPETAVGVPAAVKPCRRAFH